MRDNLDERGTKPVIPNRSNRKQPFRFSKRRSRHDFPIAANLLERNFTAAAPNRIWLADLTYIETDQGWLYLATVMDLYSRKIVGWATADHLRADLPLTALRMAISTQQPGAGLIHHSDRAAQGGFKRSSQHQLLSLITEDRQAPPPAFSSLVSSAVGH